MRACTAGLAARSRDWDTIKPSRGSALPAGIGGVGKHWATRQDVLISNIVRDAVRVGDLKAYSSRENWDGLTSR